MRKSLVVASCLTVLGLAVAGCASGAPPTPTVKPAAPAPKVETPVAKGAVPGAPSPTPKTAAEQPSYGGILLTNVGGNPPSSDIHQESTVYVLNAYGPSYSALVKYDPFKVGEIVGDLAQRWEVADGGKVYTFHLHKGVTWHDGNPLTADDVKFSLDRIAKPPKGTVSPRQMALSSIREVEAVDKDTVRVKLNFPHAAFLAMLSTGWEVIVPKHIVASRGNMKKDVVGSGPFKLVTHESGVLTDLKKNGQYFVKGRPYLDGVKVFVIADPTTNFAALRTRRLHITSQTNGITPSQAQIIEKDKLGISVARTEGMVRWQLLMRNDIPPWNDVRVRKAIDLALDRPEAIRVISEGAGSIGAPLPPNNPMAVHDAEMRKTAGYRQPKDDDIVEARRLLSDAGYPKGFDTVMIFRAGATWEKGAVFYKDQLAKLGINATLEGRDSSTFLNLLFEGRFALSSYKTSTYGWEPEFILGEHYVTGGGKNFSRFNDKEFDRMFGELRQTGDTAKRKGVMSKMQGRILEAVPFVLSHWEVYLMGLWPEVKNYLTLTDAHANNKLQEVWLAK